MKTLVTMLTALAFAAGLAGSADAGQRKKKRLHHHHYAKTYRNDDRIDGYYEQRMEAQRIGSRQWWDIYFRQRGPRG